VNVDGPSGTVTFLFTDIEGSTSLWEAAPATMRQALVRHDGIVRAAIGGRGGFVFSTGGDGFGAAFARAADAVGAALDAQARLAEEEWPDSTPVRVRMGLHTGEVDEREGDYFGTEVNRGARLMGAAHGGQVVCSAATADLVGAALPEGVGLVDLGEHRLRDLSGRLHVYQVCGQGLVARFPPLHSLEGIPGNLPLQLSSFIGREDELGLAAKALDEARLVTLIGAGGVGKTRLAVQAAAAVLPRFSDGAWLVELAAVRDPERVADAVAAVLRVMARPGLSLAESLVAFLRNQSLLLVMDNCEHLLRPVAALVAHIEAACPNVRVLATSREGLGLRGEQLLVVPSLGLPHDVSNFERMAGSEAVRLFVDRARTVRADFRLDESNAAAVAQICVRLDGIPLAIELVAARIPTLHPAELARRLDRRFRLLTGGDRLAVERHQTLQAAIDWSYDLCSSSEQRLLARLSVFAGGCKLDAVEAVCAGDPIDAEAVVDALANLVARSLVVANHTSRDARYALLETIRQYGDERLGEAGESEIVRVRHADNYIAFLGRCSAELSGPEEPAWVARLAAEYDNYQAAMNFALQTRDVERAMTLLGDLPPWIYLFSGLAVLDPEPVLALPGAADHPGYSRVLAFAAQRAFWVNDYGRALELIERSEVATRRLGPGPDAVDVEALRRSILAIITANRGDIRQGANLSLEAAEAAHAAGRLSLAGWLSGGGAQYLSWIDPDGAAHAASKGLAWARQSGSPYAIGMNLCALAMALADSNPERARQLLIEATDFGLETVWLTSACTAAGRLSEWSLLLHVAAPLLGYEQRTGLAGELNMGGILNLVARGLAPSQPEIAAQLQGAVAGLISLASAARPLGVDGVSSSRPSTTSAMGASRITEFHTQVRHDTTSLLVESIGESRVRELRARGAAMDRDLTYVFARAAIEAHFAASPTS
jgi:predicted ATPase/class 3 adenylate cyclase